MTKARLDKYDLLNSSVVKWSHTVGTSPFVGTFDMIPEDADELIASGETPKILILDDENGTKLTIKNLWVLSRLPGINPKIASVQVADRRIWLPYFNFLGRFNMRRNIGFQRVGNNVTQALNPVIPEIWYWEWSLKQKNGVPPGAKWKASEVLTEFMKQLEEWESAEGRFPAGYDFDDLKGLDDKIPVDNLNIDDSGNTSLSRILMMYPNAGLTVDENGKYILFDRNSGREAKAVVALDPLIVGAGQFREVANSLQRPRKVEVYFTIEAEIRHDYVEQVDTVAEFGPDIRGLLNVAPIPDFELHLNGELYSRSQHAWLDINKLLAAVEWRNPPGVGGRQLTQTLLQRAALPYIDLWAALLLTGVTKPDQNWAARVGCLQNNWRRSFQIAPTWMSRTLSIKARRCALIDATTGTWAPSEVFCNHSFLGTTRSFFKNKNSGRSLKFCINVPGYPLQGEQVPGKSSAPGALKLKPDSLAAPVTVEIVDGDQGIIRFDFKSDPNHIFESALPGQITDNNDKLFNSPTADWSAPDAMGISFEAVTKREQIPKLENGWKAAVIISHVPASPNNKKQLYKITVEPKDVRDKLPGISGATVMDAKGPTWQVRVGAGMDGAKALVRWLDSRAEDIEALFGITDKEPNMNELVMNHRPQAALKQEAISLSEIAVSIAAQIYSRFIDRQEGSGHGYMDPKIELRGWMDEVSHMLTPHGEMTTGVSMSQQIQEINILSMLDSSTRAVLLKLPHVDRQ